MKVVCSRKGLLDAVNTVSSVVPSRTTKEILSSIKMTAQDDVVSLVGYDGELGIRYEVRGNETARSGSAIVPASKLSDILKNSSGDKITLDTGDDVTKVTVGRSKYELPTRLVDEYPDLPSFDNNGDYHELTAGDVRTMIRRVGFAVDKKDSGGRFALKGVSWRVDAPSSSVRLVATDTRRLAVAECSCTVHGTQPKESDPFLLPPKAIQILNNSLTDNAEIVSVSLRPNDAMFQTERAMIYTSLVQGRYPPYREIIAQSRLGNVVTVTLPVKEFLASIKQASIPTDIESQRVDMVFGSGQITMKARGVDTGTSHIEMDLPGYTGKDIAISFDPIYLIEFLRAMDDVESVTLDMSGGEKPVLFRSGTAMVYLVTPLMG